MNKTNPFKLFSIICVIMLFIFSCKSKYQIIGHFPYTTSDTLVLTFLKSTYHPESQFDYIRFSHIKDTVVLSRNHYLYYKNDSLKNSFARIEIQSINKDSFPYKVHDKANHVNPIFDFSNTIRLESYLESSNKNKIYLNIKSGYEQFELEKKLMNKSYFNIKTTDYKDSINCKFISPYNNSYIALSYLREEYASIPYEDAISYFNSFTKKIKESDKGRSILREIKSRNNIPKNNHLLVNEELETISSEKIKISSLLKRNPNTLVIYGASWCGPCRRNIPTYKNIYESLKSTTTFVSVSIDMNKEQWKKSVNEDNVPWLSVLSNANFLKKNFQIFGIPYYMLLDSNGNIISNGNNFDIITKSIINHSD